MATVDDIYDSAVIVQELAEVLIAKVEGLYGFLANVVNTTHPDNVYRTTIDADDFIVIQTPLYAALLVDIETAADALGTDN